MKAKKEGFTVTYEVDDGYVGHRLHSFLIGPNDFEDDMDDDALGEFYDDQVQVVFEENISPYGTNRDEFIEWAKQEIANRED